MSDTIRQGEQLMLKKHAAVVELPRVKLGSS